MSTALLIREAAGADSPFTTPKLIKSGTLTSSSSNGSSLSCIPYFNSSRVSLTSTTATIWATDDANALRSELSGGYWMLGFRFKSIHWSTVAPIQNVIYNCISIFYDFLGWSTSIGNFEQKLYFSTAAGGSDGENVTEFSTSVDTLYPITARSNSDARPQVYVYCPLTANYLQTLSVEYEIYGFLA